MPPMSCQDFQPAWSGALDASLLGECTGPGSPRSPRSPRSPANSANPLMDAPSKPLSWLVVEQVGMLFYLSLLAGNRGSVLCRLLHKTTADSGTGTDIHGAMPEQAALHDHARAKVHPARASLIFGVAFSEAVHSQWVWCAAWSEGRMWNQLFLLLLWDEVWFVCGNAICLARFFHPLSSIS